MTSLYTKLHFLNSILLHNLYERMMMILASGGSFRGLGVRKYLEKPCRVYLHNPSAQARHYYAIHPFLCLKFVYITS